MIEEMKLVKPSVEYLDSYLGCLRRGVDPIRYRESETPLTNEIEEISNDVTKFFKQTFNMTGGGEPGEDVWAGHVALSQGRFR